mgnify:CR=1 FL=1
MIVCLYVIDKDMHTIQTARKQGFATFILHNLYTSNQQTNKKQNKKFNQHSFSLEKNQKYTIYIHDMDSTTSPSSSSSSIHKQTNKQKTPTST